MVRKGIVFDGKSPLEAFKGMIDERYVKNIEYRANVALIGLYSSEGIGSGIWTFGDVENELELPMDNDFNRFVNAIFPNYWRWNIRPEDISCALGLRRPTDLWYAYYAYMKLLAIESDSCVSFMRRYHAQLKHGAFGTYNRYLLKRKLPKIPF